VDCVEKGRRQAGAAVDVSGFGRGSGGCWALRRDELGEFAQVLGDGGEVELISGALGTSEPQAVELQDAFEVRKQHLDLLPFSS
jgi:hypothetical protein